MPSLPSHERMAQLSMAPAAVGDGATMAPKTPPAAASHLQAPVTPPKAAAVPVTSSSGRGLAGRGIVSWRSSDVLSLGHFWAEQFVMFVATAALEHIEHTRAY